MISNIKNLQSTGIGYWRYLVQFSMTVWWCLVALSPAEMDKWLIFCRSINKMQGCDHTTISEIAYCQGFQHLSVLPGWEACSTREVQMLTISAILKTYIVSKAWSYLSNRQHSQFLLVLILSSRPVCWNRTVSLCGCELPKLNHTSIDRFVLPGARF